MSSNRFTELAYPADGGNVITFPDFGVGAMPGDSREEALAQAADSGADDS